ncbi:MAG: hypothetical protein BGO49_17130 [Planctomycetales bacterium 71-10]|nr:MAG: hypothetical protein BGO49_17130 [Planctomycetales bacterium 71-10]
MDLALIARLGLRHLSTVAPEALYLRTGVDVTRPTEIRALLTDRCNYACLQCGCWRRPEVDEMPAEGWIRAIESLGEFLGRYRIQFVGGEPFVKKGFLDILECCRRNRIDFGVITNGSAFKNLRVVERFVAAGPAHVEISVDGPTPELHDRLRAAPGSLAAITAGIRNLREARAAAGRSFPIRIKSTLNAANFRTAPDLVRWAEDRGATSIDFEPLRGWTEEARGELWPTAAECDEMEGVIAELLAMQARGARIETSTYRLLRMPDHFRRLKVEPEVGTCRIGLRVYSIDPRGRVTSCGDFGAIGDASRQSAREIWTGEAARALRAETVACTKGCPYGCMASRPILPTISRGLKVFMRPAPAPTPEAGPA